MSLSLNSNSSEPGVSSQANRFHGVPASAMRVAFVCMGAESLGVEYLSAAALRAGHETRLFFDPAFFSGGLMHDSALLARLTDLRPRIVREIIRWRPRVAAFSAFSGNFRWMLSVAKQVKTLAPEIITVFGGIHVSSVPLRVLSESAVDYVLAGEADISFTEFLASVNAPSQPLPIPGLGYKIDGKPALNDSVPPPDNLDALAFPDKPLFYDKVPSLERHYMIMTGRGCPYACTYCYRSLVCPPGGRVVRRRSVPSVIDELRPVRARRRAFLIAFRDDVFTLEKKWLREFSEIYPKEIGLPYFCYTHPSALDEEKADLLRDSGCRFVTMGIQAVDENLRRYVLNRRYSNDDVERSVRLLKERRIWLSVDHILGIPGDTAEHLHQSAVFYNSLRPQRLLPFWLTYYPGTKIVELGRAAGALSDEDIERIEQGITGHRYSGGATQSARTLARFATLFALVPLLPAPMVSLLLKLRVERILPRAPIFSNLLLALCAILRRDPFFFYNIRFALSRKRVP